jgi:hypothetical protein
MEQIRGMNGQLIGRVMDSAQAFWLPSDTPFGNLQLKLFKVMERLGHANLRITESHEGWNTFVQATHPLPGNPGAHHYYAAEESVFMIRRAADELVSLVWLLEDRLATGDYPTRLALDSVAGAIRGNHPLFCTHIALLTTLNEVANAHKHSFLQSGATIFGRDEPCVIALGLKSNNLENEPALYVVSLNQLTRSFNAFLIDCLRHVLMLSQKFPNRP